MVREGNTWYVAINKIGYEFYPFIGAGSKHYKNFKTLAKRHDLDIVAEQFGVDDVTINRIEGFDENGKRVDGDSPLTSLAKRLSKGEKLDAQEELSKLCQVS